MPTASDAARCHPRSAWPPSSSPGPSTPASARVTILFIARIVEGAPGRPALIAAYAVLAVLLVPFAGRMGRAGH
ncbi:MAG: hypothetical protein U0232_17000 [Thermomicrobiales bacterium]